MREWKGSHTLRSLLGKNAQNLSKKYEPQLKMLSTQSSLSLSLNLKEAQALDLARFWGDVTHGSHALG